MHNNNQIKTHMLLLLCAGSLFPMYDSQASLSDEALETMRTGFEARRDRQFEELRGLPLVRAEKRPPLGPGRSLYTRHYSYSITDFVFRSMWFNEMIEEANEAFAENFAYYRDDRAARNDRDSFYWAADVNTRLMEFYGAGGSIAPGRLTPDSEAVAHEAMWAFAAEHSRLADTEYERNKTWHVWESENHHIQIFSTLWHFSKLLSKVPEYRDRTYDDGHTPGEHYDAWTAYASEYMRERARKGLFIESAHEGYKFMTLKGIYNFYDFAEDPELRRLSGLLLDLVWATWAEESLDGVRGGAKSRVYAGLGSQRGIQGLVPLLWYYAEIGEASRPSGNQFTVLTSDYRMPHIVVALFLDQEGRGNYEIRQRRMGLAEEGYFGNPDYRLRTDAGGILRYSYCTPHFIMGTQMMEARPFEDWTMISSQNRWQGVIFSGHPNARIYPQCEGKSPVFNGQWSVQHKGSFITHKLPANTHNRHAEASRVFFSEAGLTNRMEENGWVFAEAEGAYAAVRPARSGYVWDTEETHMGDWIVLEDDFDPIIIEVDLKENHADYAVFRQAVAKLSIEWEGDTLLYRGLDDTRLSLHTDYSAVPEINGEAINLAPDRVFDSPFVQSEWNSGVVHIRKGDREHVLDFN